MPIRTASEPPRRTCNIVSERDKFRAGVIEFSRVFFETLAEHAVPLDYRALCALKDSALALDVYTWLAHRLRRVKGTQGALPSWQNLRDQFGQEYANPKDFKKEFRRALHQVCVVYPDARIGEVIGGLILYPSLPPLAPTKVSFAGTPRPIEPNVPAQDSPGRTQGIPASMEPVDNPKESPTYPR